jgi:serine/threonine protein phosphatase 1
MKRNTRKARTFAIGDIHGAHIPLQQCLDRCGFKGGVDKLITLGDICDGWPYVYECVEILLSIPDEDRIDLEGNHDRWFRCWLDHMEHPDGWVQGGKGSARSYLRHTGKDEHDFDIRRVFTERGTREIYHFDLDPVDIPATHQRFFRNQHLFHKDRKKRLFVHAGINRHMTLKENEKLYPDGFIRDRKLWLSALSVQDGDKLKFVEPFSEIFIGHTETTNWTRFKQAPSSLVLIPTNNNDCPPMNADIIWNIDTGAGSIGRLTIMDVDTHEYWQSDPVNEIYGDYKPRG